MKPVMKWTNIKVYTPKYWLLLEPTSIEGKVSCSRKQCGHWWDTYS